MNRKFRLSAELAALGANTNAFTSYDMTAYYISCTENFEKALKLLTEYLSPKPGVGGFAGAALGGEEHTLTVQSKAGAVEQHAVALGHKLRDLPAKGRDLQHLEGGMDGGTVV